jgi:hypothetical protein
MLRSRQDQQECAFGLQQRQPPGRSLLPPPTNYLRSTKASTTTCESTAIETSKSAPGTSDTTALAAAQSRSDTPNATTAAADTATSEANAAADHTEDDHRRKAPDTKIECTAEVHLESVESSSKAATHNRKPPSIRPNNGRVRALLSTHTSATSTTPKNRNKAETTNLEKAKEAPPNWATLTELHHTNSERPWTSNINTGGSQNYTRQNKRERPTNGI